MPETRYDVLSRGPRRFLRRRRYPVWGMRWVGSLLTVSAVIVALLVFLLGRKALFVEMEISLALIALVLFVFLATGLYYGARIKWEPLCGPGAQDFSHDKRGGSWLDGLDIVTPDVGLDHLGLDLDEGCLGALLSVIAGFILLVVLILLMYWFLPLLWTGLLILMTGLFWVLNRALRFVFAKSRECQANLSRSVFYAFIYTLGYTGWLFVLIYVGHRYLTQAT